jgi:hypothetical protein
MKLVRACALAACAAGCATTKVEVSGPGAGLLLCLPGERAPTLVLWSTHWRPDQKDIPEREVAAWQGIQQFFIRSSCNTEIRSSATIPPDTTGFGRVVAITVRELGPVVRIGSPSILEGGTEVVMESKVFDGRSRALLADLWTHWQNGGPFVIKGTKTLAEDMTAALVATFW